MKRSLIKQIVGLVVLATGLHGGEFLVLKTDDPLGGTFTGEGYTRTAGFQFTVGAAPLSISALGVRDWDGGGLDNSHQVGLWDVEGNSLGGITVSPGPSTDGFRYASLVAPILLDAGHSYIIGATFINMDADRIGLSRTWENASPVYNSAVSFNVIRFGDSVSGVTFPDLLGFPDVELGQFGPNAEFALVPEPSTTVLLCSSLVCTFLVRRLSAAAHCRTQRRSAKSSGRKSVARGR
jgi:hypothetical protein